MLFDTHAHYDAAQFDSDRDAVLSALPDQGVGLVVNPGCDLESSRKAAALAERYPFLYAAVGVHPEECADWRDSDVDELRTLATQPRVVAVGEIGLDYYWKEPEPALQKKWFERQLELAREVKMPVIIHSRDAAKDTLDMMQALHAEEMGGVVHCYSYTKELAREYLNMDFYFGIGGVITFKNAKKLKEAVAYIPLERILLETDSPYLSPEPNRGKRNSSLNLPYIAEAVAELKGIGSEEVIEVTRQNAERLFRLG